MVRLRLAALLAQIALTLFAFAPGLAFAAGPELVRWDALVPSVEPYDDPFLDMTPEHKSDLRAVLRANDAKQQGIEDRNLQEASQAARQRLESAGLDADSLLEQRLFVMERREEAQLGVTSAYLDQEVLVDGYVLPLNWSEGRATEFLLVPWVGACIHTPPPPPNQMIHVTYPEGLPIEGLFEPRRLSGTMRHQPAEHLLFLVDGTRVVPVSYALQGATISGVPGEIVAASASDMPVLLRLQIWIRTLFESGMSAIAENGSPKAMLSALLLAFAYGAVHTFGPGHGKAVVISYFIGTGGSLRRGLIMGGRIAVFHVLSAVVVVFLLDFAVRQTTGAAPSDYRAIRLGSYGLIVLIGAIMLWKAVAAYQSHNSEGAHVHHHDHGGHAHAGCLACEASAARNGGGWLAAAVGVVPCTGALLVMLFGLANDLIVPAIIMVAAISAGMAVAMSAIGIAALLGRGWAERRFATDLASSVRFDIGTQFAGATFVLVIGLSLFWLTLTHT